jgi:hypothetical protein
MHHRSIAALASVLLATAACAEMGGTTAPRGAAASPRPAAETVQTTGMMQAGQRMQVAAMPPGATLRNVMISQGGGGIDLVYDMPQGSPQSQRVLRLENVNGMLEVQYDTAMPSSMPLGSGGTPRLVQGGGGMYDVVYDTAPSGRAAGGSRRAR